MAKAKTKPKLGRPANTDSDDTRRAILDAALHCFASAGFRSTSIRTIAEKAGVTVGTIYHYFDNKESLILAVHHEVQEMSLALVRDKLEGATSLTAGWAELSDVIFEAHVRQPEIAKFQAVMEVASFRSLDMAEARYDQEWRKIYRELADLGVKTGEVKAGKEHELAIVLWAISLGITRHAIQAPVGDHKVCLQGFVDLFEGKLVAINE